MKYLGSKKIITDRLELREQSMEEQKYLWTVLMNGKVNKYFLTTPVKFAEKLKNWEIQEPFYREKISKAGNKDNFEWSIFLKNTKTCIGRIVCQKASEEDDSIRDVGWIIDPIYQRKGYATEAARAMLNFMFNECLISEIRTAAATINPASWKLMEKLGCERLEETSFHQYTYVDGMTECYNYYLNKEMFNNKNN